MYPSPQLEQQAENGEREKNKKRRGRGREGEGEGEGEGGGRERGERGMKKEMLIFSYMHLLKPKLPSLSPNLRLSLRELHFQLC